MNKLAKILIVALAPVLAISNASGQGSEQSLREAMEMTQRIHNPSVKADIQLAVIRHFYLPVKQRDRLEGSGGGLESYVAALKKIDLSATTEGYKQAFQNYVEITQKAAHQPVAASEQEEMYGLLARSARGWNFSPSEEKDIRDKFHDLADLKAAENLLGEAVGKTLSDGKPSPEDEKAIQETAGLIHE